MEAFVRDKKAISPVLATLLLIAIAVGAAVVTYAWTMGFVGTQTATAGVVLVKDRTYNWTATDVTVTVRNTGTATATLDVVYWGTSPGVYPNSGTLTGSIDPGATTDVTITGTFASGSTYYFKIVCTNGYALEFSDRYP